MMKGVGCCLLTPTEKDELMSSVIRHPLIPKAILLLWRYIFLIALGMAVQLLTFLRSLMSLSSLPMISVGTT